MSAAQPVQRTKLRRNTISESQFVWSTRGQWGGAHSEANVSRRHTQLGWRELVSGRRHVAVQTCQSHGHLQQSFEVLSECRSARDHGSLLVEVRRFDDPISYAQDRTALQGSLAESCSARRQAWYAITRSVLLHARTPNEASWIFLAGNRCGDLWEF